MAEFVHLHVHSQYSTLDGALRVKDLTARVAELGMKAVAITDHANMFGAIQLNKYAKLSGIAPIYGCEINVAVPNGTHSKQPPAINHLILLAASLEGYHNLVRIVSRAHTHPIVPDIPSVLIETVAAHTKGVICLTGCMGGWVQQRILQAGEQAGLDAIDFLRSAFEPGHLFVELQNHNLPEQPIVNGILADLASKLELPLVGTNVAHFRDRDDGEAQLYLQCIQINRPFRDVQETHHGSFEMYLKSPSEMEMVFKDYPTAVSNTMLISEMCTGWELKLGNPMLPNFKVPENFNPDSYFQHIAEQGLEQRFEEFRRIGKERDFQVYRERLAREIGVIVSMKFPGYFLIVWDFIRYAKEHGIPVGPGRGSGAGSLVAYAMRITDLDPLDYNLLFERFLNPERVSMPDFDIDFCMDKREGVIAYVAEKYGKESVGQIATFHELKARSVIKDVARAMQFEPVEAGRISALIPMKGPGATYTIPEVLKDKIEPKLISLMETDARVKELINQAQKLEGLTRHAGMHAAGVVISEGPLWDHVPVFVSGEATAEGPAEGALLVTQYHKDDVEQAGLVKFDFLGLKTLTVIDICVEIIRKRPDQVQAPEPFDLAKIPLDDLKTYLLLQSGDTTGVFQLESSGMQQLFRDLKPDRFEDIVAAVALYRPGPLETGMVKDFVECKHGRQPIKKMHALIDELLEPTYGVIVYQEQVMQIAQQLAGYTLGGADLLRRAMGKKKAEEMAKQKGTFVSGALEKGVTEEESSQIFDLVEKFAGYGFNKSHSAAYALITYQTAYLKTHFPAEFLCALMTADKDKTEKVVRIIAEAHAWGVKVLPPCINQSQTEFSVVYENQQGKYVAKKGSKVKDGYNPQIRFGLGAVRGVGSAALESVFETRNTDGDFQDIFDFASRVDAKKLNRGVLEALVQCGAFDTTLVPLGITRARAFSAIDLAIERGKSASKDRARGQTNLFDLFAAAAPASANDGAINYPQAEPWDLREILVREKQSLGFYLSGHPLDRYGKDLSRFDVIPTIELSSRRDWEAVKVAGMVEGYREKTFKGGGGKVAFFDLEDTVGRVTVKVRDRQINEFGHILTAAEPLIIAGKLSFPPTSDDDDGDSGPREPTLFLNEASMVSAAICAETRSITINLSADSLREEQFKQLRDVLEKCPGRCPVSLVLTLGPDAEAILALPAFSVEPSDAMLAGLERVFGQKVAQLH
jgi:DNA polymerase III subunit alpha